MTVTFDRPVGAAADLAELEYVSALHQTQSDSIRTDGSIRDVDIMYFLRSRYGLEVDLQTVRQTVLYGLGGDFEGGAVAEDGGSDGYDENEEKDTDAAEADDKEEDIDGIDLAELAAILLIPTLLKTVKREHSDAVSIDNTTTASAAVDGSDKLSRSDFPSDQAYIAYRRQRRLVRSLRPDRGLVQDVFAMIMRDVTGSPEPQPLTPDLIRSMLTAFGEGELAENDELVEDMVRAAAGGGSGDKAPVFDADAFARGLTSDVLLLDVDNEARVSTNYDDVLLAAAPLEERLADDPLGTTVASRTGHGDFVDEAVPEEAQRGGDGVDKEVDPTSEERLKLTYSAASIDYIADQYRSKGLVVFLWTGFVLTYFAFGSLIDQLIANESFDAKLDGRMAECDSMHGGEPYPSVFAARDVAYCHEELWDEELTRTGIRQDWDCPTINERTDWGCLILKSVVYWLYLLGLLAALGILYIGLGSIGNDIRTKRTWTFIFGIVSIGLLVGFLFWYNFRNEDWSEDYSFDLSYNKTDGTEGWLFVDLTNTGTKSLGYELVVDILAVVVSGAAILLQFRLMLGPLLNRCCAVSRRCCSWGSDMAAELTSPGSVRSEAKIKQAAARKINALVKNARDVHGSSIADHHGGAADGETASFGQGLIKFSLQGHKTERAGGFLWTWRQVFSGQLYTVEGVWISSRIWAGNLTQFLISLVIVAFGAFLTKTVVAEWQEGLTRNGLLYLLLKWAGFDLNIAEIAMIATTELNETVEQFVELSFGDQMMCSDTISDVISVVEVESNTSVEVDPEEVCLLLQVAATRGLFGTSALVEKATSFAVNATNSLVDKVSNTYYPKEEYMVKAPMILATIVAFLSVIVLALIYIPSVISTTLQFRSGLIPFMHARKSNQVLYRTAMDQVTLILGSMFWGALYSSGFLGAIFGLVLFLFLWQATRVLMANITAGLIGLVITLSLKMLLVHFGLRNTVFRAFYRRKPAQGNIISLILEVANIGYAVGTALGRSLKLVLISALYIGRLDTPLLADGVGLGPLRDTYPTIFRKDILAHESHRHPYLEVLGLIYMMKIRYGEKFGDKAGYCYRLIFVVALMPWIRKYRVMARPNLLDDEHKSLLTSSSTFDNSLLLPKSSILHSSVIAASVLSSANSPSGQVECAVADSEIEKLRAENQLMRQALEDANIDVTKVRGLRASM